MQLYPFQVDAVKKLEKVKAVLIGDDMGLGKSLPFSEPVLTPQGFISIDKISTGDYVIGSNGKPTKVIGVYQQGIRKVYKVYFSDNTYSRCDIEHLWTVTTPADKKNKEPYKTLTTAQLISNRLHDGFGNRKYFLPMIKPVEFGNVNLPIDPYFLGVLIGDGNLSQLSNVTLTTDLEIVKNLVLPKNVTKSFFSSSEDYTVCYGFSGLLPLTRSIGIQGFRSEHKFIPEAYKLGSSVDRIAILQGLLDTDGSNVKSRNQISTTIEYGTTSKQLSIDVDFIVRSLGGTTSTRTKFPTYTYKGEELDGQPFYRMVIKLPTGIIPFRLKRKLERWTSRSKYEPSKAIVSIEPDGEEECVCIRVEAEDSLYATRDFTLTHNTHEAIVLDLNRRAQFPNYKLKTLIVCPLSMISTWTRTWFQWSPELRILPINNKDRTHFTDELNDDNYDVFICHWPVLRLVPELADVNWFHVIADEAHALQNRKAKQTLALKHIPAGYKSALTGTPAFDKPDDLWSILNWLYPRFWSSYWRYYNDHIIFSNFNGYKTIIGVNNPEKLQAEMDAFYIRRRKEDVLLDLPNKYHTEVRVDLHPQQMRAYKSMKDNMLAWIGQHEQDPVVAPIVIAQLTRLQQFACAFAEYDELKERITLSEPSSKLDAVIEIIESTGQQVVVFSQFAQVIKLLAARLEKKGITCGKFIGDTPANERAGILSGFQDGKIQVFAGTISAGGMGITLTAASTVIFVDRSWSNALNIQAEDRLHRIGQKSAVQVIDIIANDTIDAKRIKVIKAKWAWIRRLIGDTKTDPTSEDFDEEDE